MEKNTPKVMKQIEPKQCPHCGKDIYISSQTVLAIIGSISTLEDLKKAKEEVLKGLEGITFASEQEKKNAIAFINNQETLFDGSDVDTLIKNIGEAQVQKIQAQENAKSKKVPDKNQDSKRDDNSQDKQTDTPEGEV